MVLPEISKYLQLYSKYLLVSHDRLNCFRDNRFLGFLYRGIQPFLVSLPMNIVFFYIFGRFFRAQRWNLATFGVFGIGEKIIVERKKKSKFTTIYDNPVLIPFAWNFFINMLLIIFYANIDVRLNVYKNLLQINSRVASTQVIYYWAFAQLISDYQADRLGFGGKLVALLAILHNIVYMCLNLVLFPNEIAFF